MYEFKLLPIESDEIAIFKTDMQEAFLKGAEADCPDLTEEILPEADIDRSLSAKGAAAYKALVDGKMAGGVIVVIDEVTQHNHLDFLYVKYGVQSKGIGQAIWREIERLYPKTKVWETCTPYFEKRNIHFYVNRCGFHIVEFYNPYHKDPHSTNEETKDDYFFRFEKVM